LEWISPDNRGKQPKGNAWRERALRDPPEATTASVDPNAVNTGILSDGLRAIDIDIDNPTLAHTVKSMALSRFGEAPMRYRDNSPRVLLLYRAETGQPPKLLITSTLGKVEILGAGQQFVAFGTHKTGAPLQWMPEAPGEASADTLPAISEADVQAFLEDASRVLGAKAPGPAAAGAVASPRGLGADPLQVVAALVAIPNNGPPDWEYWNRIGMAAWAATGGSAAGRAAWHAWSQQNPAYDPAAADERWNHYAISPPSRIGAGTLFHLAREAEPAVADDPTPDPETTDPGWWESLERRFEDGVSGEIDEPPQTSATSAEAKTSSVIDPRDWTAPAPLRQWLVQDWIPIGYVTGLYGDGGLGKSLLAQQLMTSVACALPWLGMDVKGGKSFGFMCEDDPDELHRRQESINGAYGLQMRHLENLRYSSRVGADNLLMTFDERNRGNPTELFRNLAKYLSDYRPKLVVIDTLADTFGGDEIKRAHARLFIQGICGNLAREYECAVVICAHPSAAGISSGSGTGGSTAWSNTFRSRLYLQAQKEQPDGRVLSRMKANYAPANAELSLEWRDGCFMPKTSAARLPAIQWNDIQVIFAEIVRGWHAGEPWSNSPQTKRIGRYLPLWAQVHLGIQERVVAKFIDEWLAGGYLKSAVFDAHRKVFGLKVVRHLQPPVGDAELAEVPNS